jgi:alkanesulfonate monooxygenase SsuD/methylene tetrahydromethanopterin reductase-like flavin-dependent oxidoreductase (luciferase family)
VTRNGNNLGRRVSQQAAGPAAFYRGGMRIGVILLPEHRWAEARPRWHRAEQLGFDHAWTYDHLAWRSLRDADWHAAIPTLTAAALATERIRLGTLVLAPTYRHPVAVAKEVVTLDDVSGGRLTLGIGAGGTGWDATVLGGEPWSARERADRFTEFVELLDLCLRQPVTTHEGRYYAAHEARRVPACVQRPRVPFAVAATGPRGMRLAAAHGQAWVTTGDRRRMGEGPIGPAEGAAMVRRQADRLDEACAAVGRDPSTLDRLVVTGPILDPGLAGPEAWRDTVGRYAEAGVTDLVVHWPRPGPPYEGDERAFERIFAA